MVWMEMNGIQLEKPLSFTDVIRIGIAKAVKLDHLKNADVFPATGHY